MTNLNFVWLEKLTEEFKILQIFNINWMILLAQYIILQNLELSCIRGNSAIEVTNKFVDSLTFDNVLIQQEFTYLNKCLNFYFFSVGKNQSILNTQKNVCFTQDISGW